MKYIFDDKRFERAAKKALDKSCEDQVKLLEEAARRTCEQDG